MGQGHFSAYFILEGSCFSLDTDLRRRIPTYDVEDPSHDSLTSGVRSEGGQSKSLGLITLVTHNFS